MSVITCKKCGAAIAPHHTHVVTNRVLSTEFGSNCGDIILCYTCYCRLYQDMMAKCKGKEVANANKTPPQVQK